MKTLKVLVVSGDQQYRDSISTLMRMVGHDVFGARTANQAAGFTGEHGSMLDAVIVDFDSVQVNMEEFQAYAPQACFILQSNAFQENSMPNVAVGTLLASKRIETARIEEYLQQLVPLQQFAAAA